jgi:hypothetical protein
LVYFFVLECLEQENLATLTESKATVLWRWFWQSSLMASSGCLISSAARTSSVHSLQQANPINRVVMWRYANTQFSVARWWNEMRDPFDETRAACKKRRLHACERRLKSETF